MRVVSSLGMVCALGAFACGGLATDGDDGDFYVTGLSEAAADTAGGRFVKNQGRISPSRTKTGVLTARARYHGYVIEAARGEALSLRFILPTGMGTVALYGPQAASGDWGPQRIQRWVYRPLERNLAKVSYEAPRAGNYLVVVGGAVQTNTEWSYALTVCKGECRANVCLEWGGNPGSYYATNFATRGEAEFMLPSVKAAATAWGGAAPQLRTGTCGGQPSTCPRTASPVCGRVMGYRGSESRWTNVCVARAYLRDVVGTELGQRNLWADSNCP